MASKARMTAALFVSVTLLSFSVAAFRVSPSSFHLEQAPGTEATYTLVITDDTDRAEEIQLYLGDWLRTASGEHDWDVPLDGARWTLSRSFAAGDTVQVRYAVPLPAGRNLQVSGGFVTQDPRLSGTTSGPVILGPSGGAGGEGVTPGAGVSVTRKVEGVDAAGVVTVALEVQALGAFTGMTLYEKFSEHVGLESLDAAGGTFVAVARSCADWIGLSDSRLRLEPGESREITLRLSTPPGFSGTYWGVVFAESAPTPENRAGTQILSIYRTAIKIYVTAPGTEQLGGRVTDVRVTGTAPLALSVGFSNTGNVQLTVAGAVDVIDQTGTTVRTLPIAEFYVLPEGRRDLEVVDPSAAGLPAGVYQAVVRLDFGGESPVGGVRSFRVK